MERLYGMTPDDILAEGKDHHLEKCMFAYALHHVVELSETEISDRTGIPRTTINGRIKWWDNKLGTDDDKIYPLTILAILGYCERIIRTETLA